MANLGRLSTPPFASGCICPSLFCYSARENSLFFAAWCAPWICLSPLDDVPHGGQGMGSVQSLHSQAVPSRQSPPSVRVGYLMYYYGLKMFYHHTFAADAATLPTRPQPSSLPDVQEFFREHTSYAIQ